MNVRKNAMLLLSLLLCAGRLMATDSVAQSGAEPSKPNLTAGEGRSTVSINGTWQIEESVGANEIPSAFNHSMVVPGMVSLAQPSFTNVGFFASREYLRRFKGNYPFLGPQVLAKDAALTAEVKSLLIAEPGIRAFDINVDTYNSTVALKGTVKSGAQRALAERVARKARGVKSVHNELKTR